ncbi:MAG: hypothetical protein HYX53_03290 [Chloroflexi bacterium]|nr:hypothetical protein [Chloroflexota bacterium]
MVLNQECDLQFDHLARNGLPLKEGRPPVSGDKRLRSILLCPGFDADHVLAGTYVDGASRWPSKTSDILLSNRDDRYHVLQPEPPLMETKLAFDFKLIVTATPSYLEQWLTNHPESSVAALEPPFRDRLIQRFVSYLGRIAEPEEM